MIAALRRRLRDSRGISSVEVMVAMMIMASVVMGTAATSTTALRVASSGQEQSDMAAAVQYQLETLLQDYDALTSGSAMVGDYAMKWEVTGTDPKKILMYVYDMSGSTRTSLAPSTGYASDSDQAALSPSSGGTTATTTDTVVAYLADPTP
jgi:Tfp pilus assembly protein PilV